MLLIASVAIMFLGAGLPSIEQLDETVAATRIHVKHVTRKDGSTGLSIKEMQSVLAIRGERIPQHLFDALVAKEDRRFYEHGGIDLRAVAAAFVAGLRGSPRGASTVTMQLARLLCMQQDRSRTRTLIRKAREWILSWRLEERYEKKQLLTHYLNRVFFGHGAFGVEVAARRFFQKAAADLSVYESAMLIGVLPRPSKYKPDQPGSDERGVAGVVLKAMLSEGYLTEEELARALASPVQHGDRPLHQTSPVAFFEWIEPQLRPFFPEPGDEGLVFATIDPEIQTYAEIALSEVAGGLSERGVTNAAVAVIDPRDGAVVAMVGAIDFKQSQYNHATKAQREIGSTFKPFVYLAALESGGWSPRSRVPDTPIRFADGWSPRNADGRFLGEISLSDALAKSRNAATVYLQEAVGRGRVRETASRLAPDTEWVEDATLALGTTPMTLLDLTAAYAPFANGGMRIVPHGIVAVRSLLGGELMRYDENAVPVVEARHVTAMNGMMRAVLQPGGTGRRAALSGHDAAGKTGTTQMARDAWFVGYTAQLLAGIWMGNDDQRRSMDASINGGGPPAVVWRNLMDRVHRLKPLEPKPLP